MSAARLKQYLEVATNVAVVLVAVVVLSIFARDFLWQGQKPQLEAGLARGQKLNRLPITVGNDGRRTLLIALSTTCHYCKEEIPFYNHLAQAIQEGNRSTAIVAMFSSPDNEAKEYAQRERLNLSIVAAVDLSVFNVRGTPTMVLIDGGGKVLDFWVGKLSSDEEQQVLRAVGVSGT